MPMQNPAPRSPRSGRLGHRIQGVLILSLAFLMAMPPALAQQASPLVTANFNDARIEQVLQILTAQSGVSITPLGKAVGERVSVFERDAELEAVLNKIAQPKGWTWWRNEDGSYGLADEEWYKANILPSKVITKVFRPDHVKASELEKAIRPMLTQGISRVTADDRTNKLIIVDLPEVIERIERLIREIDVQLFTRVFYIRFANVADIAQKIESYKSDPGRIEVDEKTHQIIVTDLLSNIKKMELLIDILDIGPEIVIYDVHNIGLEGEDLEDLKTIIETIRTPDLLFEVNEKQGVFILEDVPEIHERVEQILSGFDLPVKQVLIQGEVLQSTFQRDLGFGLRRAIFTDNSLGITQPGDVTLGGDGFRPITTPYDFAAMQGNTITGAILNTKSIFEWEASFSDSGARVLLQPRLLVKNQENSQIFVGREEPYLTTFFNDNNDNVGRSTGQQTVTDGLTFDITPSISNSYLVELEISIDNDNAEVVTRQSTEGPVDLIARDRQNIETVLTIPSGETRTIGGLIEQSSSDSVGGVPFLAKLPYVGALFGFQSRSEGRRQLQIFITPTVVEDVIPRMTGEGGRRGRMVTNFEKVPGSFDLNFDSRIASEEDPLDEDLMAPVQQLLAPTDAEGFSSEEDIDQLLRESTQREVISSAPIGTNFRPGMGTTGNPTLGSGPAPAPNTPPAPAAPATPAATPAAPPAGEAAPSSQPQGEAEGNRGRRGRNQQPVQTQ